MDFIIVKAFSPGMRILSCRWGASDGTIALDLAPAEEATHLTCNFRLGNSSRGSETNTVIS